MKYSVPSDIINLRQLEFYKRLKFELGDQIYLVGGAVRDMLLDKPVKDYDLLVTGLPLDDLETILSGYGKVDAVGKSFGILKFRPIGHLELEFDIAVPRIETKTGDGHTGFKVELGHVTLEQDLFRRDFTINAMALALDSLLIVDPYGGREDIEKGSIRVVNPNAFQEDPLRMLRAVQFGARFGFTIEEETRRLIFENIATINQISGERVLGELEKIVSKGKPSVGALLLMQTGLYTPIFGRTYPSFKFDSLALDTCETVAEFVFVMTYGGGGAEIPPTQLWKERLKGDIAGYKEIQALEVANDVGAWRNSGDSRYAFHRAFSLSTRIMDTDLIPNESKKNRSEFRTGYMPTGLKDLEINGEDLLAAGYEGFDIGIGLKGCLLGIYREEVRNEKAALMAFVAKLLPLTPNENPASNADSATNE